MMVFVNIQRSLDPHTTPNNQNYIHKATAGVDNAPFIDKRFNRVSTSSGRPDPVAYGRNHDLVPVVAQAQFDKPAVKAVDQTNGPVIQIDFFDDSPLDLFFGLDPSSGGNFEA